MESDEESSPMQADLEEEDVDGDVWKELHQSIQEGDIQYVRRVLQSDSGGQHFSYEGKSALYLAFSHKRYDIASHLIHKGAKVYEPEGYNLYRLEIDLKRLNYLLLDYNRKSEKSCIYQLTSWSQSPQGLDGDRLRAVMRLYEEFYESQILRLLMKVLEKEPFDIVYDFESELVDRTHRLYPVESEIYGLTLSNSGEIFVGAKTLLCGEYRKRAKVYGVVAEEMCHLALTILFQNDAKPYREEDSKLRREFQEIVNAVRSSLDRACHVEKVIKDVYENYEYRDWECELIARVPHVVGLHGEESGRVIMESRELSRLFEFYTHNVHPKFKEYTDPSLNTKAHRLMEQALRKNDYISFQEKQVQPLKEGFPSFRKSLVDVEGIYVIATNCEKLCTLQIYHELKREHGDALEKRCVFLTRKNFEKESERILDALKGRVWEYLILVLDEKDLNLRRLTCEYVDEFEKFKGGAMKVVIISSSKSLGPKFEKEAVRYKWNDLTEDFKALQQEIRYLFKGERESEYIAKEYFHSLFSEEEIIGIISGAAIEVSDGKGLNSQGFTPETYIDRDFRIMTVDLEFLKHLPSNSSVFLSNVSKSNFRELPIDDGLVQWLKGSGDEIKKDKSIFIDNIERPMSFEEFGRKNPEENNIWLRYVDKVLYLRYTDLCGDCFQPYSKQIKLSEKEMLQYLKENKVVIISDNAGYGKSTVISSLIRGAKETFQRSWIWRIDFNVISKGNKDPLSLANINPDSDEEDMLDYFYLMLGLNTGFEKYLFQTCSKYGQCIVFLDGFDEIPSKYTANAFKLLSFLSEKTDAKLIVTTRKHHQVELEKRLNAVSHQLVEFSGKDRITYLDKFWKYKLKYPNGEDESKKDQRAVAQKIRKIIKESKRREANTDPEYQDLILALEKIDCVDNLASVRLEIDRFDFTKLAQNVIDKTSLFDSMLGFTAIPLHLYMIGNIFYDGNFDIELQSEVFQLYYQFIEQKILIFIEEKEGNLKEGELKDETVKRKREDAYRIHMELALQLIDKGEDGLSSELVEDDLRLCLSLGIVFIHTNRVQFLHRTFAEFFLAEYARKTVRKEVLLTIVSQFHYNVVRRFLSSALEEKNFENVDKKFFQDSAFLVNVMDKIFTLHSQGRIYESDSDDFCRLKIAKTLLQQFETIDVTKELVNKFIDGLHELVTSKRKTAGNFHYCWGIGGCFTASMFKDLLRRDFALYSKSILTFVRVAETPEEVVDVLKECILINIDVLWYLRCMFDNDNAGKEEKDAIAESLMDMLTLNVPRKMFFIHALSNERAEIFARILQLFIDDLGEETFITEFVRSEEYTEQMILFLDNVHPNRCCSTFDALHSVFGDGMGKFLHRDFKFWMLHLAVQVDSSGKGPCNTFEKVMSLFGKCLGIEKTKEFILSSFLIHKTMLSGSSCIFTKHLQVVEKNVNDAERMKEFLKSSDESSRNVFHYAVSGNWYLNDLLKFYKERIETNEIREMISSSHMNAIHYIFLQNSSEKMKTNLEAIKDLFIGDHKGYVNLLKSRDEQLRNIFHLVAVNLNKVNLTFLNEHLTDREITKLLMQRDDHGSTFLHHAAFYNLKDLPFFLEYANEMIKTDRRRLIKLILKKNKQGNTFLHVLQSLIHYMMYVNVPDLVNNIFAALREMLSPEVFKRFLKKRTKRDKHFFKPREETSLKSGQFLKKY